MSKVAQLCSARLGIFVVNLAGVHILAFISPFLFMIAFILDNCKKFGLVFDNVVGIVEVINSRDIQIQVNIYLKNKYRQRTSREKKAQCVATRDFRNSQEHNKCKRLMNPNVSLYVQNSADVFRKCLFKITEQTSLSPLPSGSSEAERAIH